MRTNIKMKVTPEQSIKVQEICFANGIIWTHKVKQLTNLHLPYLYICDIEGIYATLDIECFNDHKEYEQMDADLFIRTNGTCEEQIVDEYKDIRDALVKGKIIQLNGTAINGGYGETWNDCKQEDLFIYSRSAYRIKDDEYSIIGKEIDFQQTQYAINNLTIALLEQKLKKKNEILKKARIKRKNQREELHKLNIKLQKCISLEEHKEDIEFKNEIIKEIEDLNYLNKSKLHLANLSNIEKQKEIEKLKAVIEYLESKLK